MWINIRGVKDVGIVTNALSIFVIAAFAMVAIIGFTHWGGNPFEPVTAYPIESGSDWIFYIGAGLSIGMWMYSGYESMSTVAGELENPQVIPRATLITVPLIAAVYILPTMASVSAFKTQGEDFSFLNWASEGEGVIGYSTVADHFLGPAAGIFFVVVAVIAQFSIYNTYVASGSRGFFALAEDNLSPKFLVKVDKKHGVPYIAVISVAVVNLALCMFDFSTLVVVDVFLLVSSYIMVYISAIILRRRIPREEYKFMIPGGMGFLKIVCIVPICIAFFSFLVNGADYFIGGMLGIITGPLLYYIWKRMYGGLSKKDARRFPLNPKTRLALGDMNRIAIIFLILTAIGVAGCFFLPWYEAEWAYPDDYDMTLFASQSALWGGIRVVTIVCAVFAVVFGVLGRKLEPRRQEA
jgi:amino acid transporter